MEQGFDQGCGLHAFQGGQRHMDALVHLREKKGARGWFRIPRGERQPQCRPVY